MSHPQHGGDRTGDSSSAPLRAGAREWTGMAVLSLPTMLLTMDLTVLHLAVPHLSADLAPSATQLLWITDVYGFLIAGFLIPMGSLGDRVGRRRLLLAGAAVFAAASVLAAYAPTAGTLIAARALMGVAGATLMPSTLALIRTMFHDPAQRSAAIGAWMASFMVGGAIGPLAGGALLENFWWGSVFLLALPVMGLLLVLGPLLLPEYRTARPGPADPLSALLSLAAVLAAVYGVKEAAAHGIGWGAAGAVAAGAALGAVFVHRQRVLEHPMVDLRLFANRSFSTSIGVMTVGAALMMGINLFIAQYLQMVLGMSPLRAGLWTLPMVGAMLAGTVLATAVARHVRPAYVMGAGLALAAVGFTVVAQADGAAGLTAVVAGSAVFAAGLAPVSALGTDIVVGAAPPERAGAASAVSETGNELGGALGIAVLGSIGAAVYRARTEGALPPGLAPEEAESAGGSIGGAVAVAERLTGPEAAVVLETAQEAFTHGMRAASLSGAVLLAASAVLAAAVLRRVRSTAHTSAERTPDPSGTGERGRTDPVA
ncbi:MULTISPECIES: MFS transporter [unclassified Nocardiopsis]|uniref:MFS transporter n=1 Tax=unclassified Nocardiopsis TaxID=2649073 RepID=UPI00135998D5|nr:MULTISPECIES: MFS transporter [unclassified Nocardiopsis]